MAVSPRTRRWALGAGAALVLGAIPLVPALTVNAAAAGKITAISPNVAANTSATPQTITFTFEVPMARQGNPGEPGTQVELEHTTTGETIVGDVVDTTQPPGTSVQATFVFGAERASNGTLEAPAADPGQYDAYVYQQGTTRDAGNACENCFTIFSSAPTVTDTHPDSVPAGKGGQVYTVYGTSFARGTVVKAYFPGTTTEDPNIKFECATQPTGNPPPLPATECRENEPNRMEERITVFGNAAPGLRDIVALNTDGQSGRLANALRVTSVVVDSVSPTADDNSGPPVDLTFSGRGFVAGSQAELVALDDDSAIAGTAETLLSPTSLKATFDLNGARATTYYVRVTNPDGTTTLKECSPARFTVVNTSGSTATASPSPTSTATSTPSPNAFSCQNAAGSPTPTPTPTSTATRTSTATPSPTSTSTSTTTASPSPTSTTPARTPADVTASINVSTITSGNAPTLSGRVTDAQGQPVANRQVTILAKEYNSDTYQPFQADDEPILTDADGNYTAVVRPVRQTAFGARVGNVDSNSVLVRVYTRVNLDRSMAGRTVPTNYVFTGDLDPDAADICGAAVGLVRVVSSGGRTSYPVIGQANSLRDGECTYRLTARNGLPRGTHTFVVFTSARNGLLKGAASVRLTVQ